MLQRPWNIIANSWHTKSSVLISFFCYISKTKFICSSKIIIRSHFVFIGLAFNASACIPCIGLNSNSKGSFRRELFLSQIHVLAKLVLFPINEVMKVAFHKDCLVNIIVMGLRRKDLLDFVMNWIFFN